MADRISEKVRRFLEETCIFCQPWWLEAISPDHWDVAVVRRGEEIAAVWPYIYKVRLKKYWLLELPPIYSYLGPWLRESNAKYAKKLNDQKKLLIELINGLPPFASFVQWFHPSVTNWLPFYWNGFEQTTRYTYVIQNTEDIGAIWEEMEGRTRTDIRKAENQVESLKDNDIERFLSIQRATFKHQGMALPYPEETLFRLDEACAKNEARQMLFAVDAKGRAHAAVYLVWDHKTVYAVLRGGDPSLRESGANSLLMWKSIEFASNAGKAFDCAGSWVESIENFVRGFGARQVAFFEISKMNSRLVRYYRRLYSIIHS